VVSAEVLYENGKEDYRNLAIDGKPVKKSMEEVGGPGPPVNSAPF